MDKKNEKNIGVLEMADIKDKHIDDLLSIIQGELKVEKSRKSKQFPGGTYRNADDIMKELKPLLLKHQCNFVLSHIDIKPYEIKTVKESQEDFTLEGLVISEAIKLTGIGTYIAGKPLENPIQGNFALVNGVPNRVTNNVDTETNANWATTAEGVAKDGVKSVESKGNKITDSINGQSRLSINNLTTIKTVWIMTTLAEFSYRGQKRQAKYFSGLVMEKSSGDFSQIMGCNDSYAKKYSTATFFLLDDGLDSDDNSIDSGAVK